jgi:hypothetical protein
MRKLTRFLAGALALLILIGDRRCFSDTLERLQRTRAIDRPSSARFNSLLHTEARLQYSKVTLLFSEYFWLDSSLILCRLGRASNRVVPGGSI